MFFPWKKIIKPFVSFCCKISFLFGIRGDERHHKSNVSLIQSLKWNHTLTPSAKGTLNTSAHGPRLNSQPDSLFLMALGSEALRCIWYTQWASFSSSFLFYVWSSTTQNQLDIPKSAGELKRQQMNVQGNTHLQLTSTYNGKTNKQTKKVVTLSRVLTKWLSCTYPHIDQKLFRPKPVITLFRRVRISDLSPSIKRARRADSASRSIEKVAERARNSTLKLFPISCTVNVYCRAAARSSHTSHRSLSVPLEANQKLTERENKRKKACKRIS